MSDCPRFGKWIAGCKFEPRYHTAAPDLSRFREIHGPQAPEVIRAVAAAKQYVGDVCIRCGKVARKE